MSTKKHAATFERAEKKCAPLVARLTRLGTPEVRALRARLAVVRRDAEAYLDTYGRRGVSWGDWGSMRDLAAGSGFSALTLAADILANYRHWRAAARRHLEKEAAHA